MKKNPNSLSTEELLKLLDSLDDIEQEIEHQFDNSVLSFVQNFNLNPGKDKVTKKHLHKLYNLWNRKPEKITQHSFTSELAKYFKHDTSFYYIDKSLFNIADFIQKEIKKRKIDKTKSKKWHTHFTDFIEATELSPGKVYLEIDILYYIYVVWRKLNRKYISLSRGNFTSICHLYFELKTISKNDLYWVGVSENIKNLITPSEVARWRNTRNVKNKKDYKPYKTFKKFVLYWEEKNQKRSDKEP